MQRPNESDNAGILTAARITIGLAMSGALYLIWARHEAILADLAGLSAWCF